MHNNDNSAAEYDFDQWNELANQDPEEFERQRRIAIEDAINSAPASMHKRLRGLQWRIDMERERSGNPIDSCVRIHRMMIEKVYSTGGLLDSLNRLFENQNRNETRGNTVSLEANTKP